MRQKVPTWLLVSNRVRTHQAARAARCVGGLE